LAFHRKRSGSTAIRTARRRTRPPGDRDRRSIRVDSTDVTADPLAIRFQ
jgi:hypothetical protein